MSYSRQRAVPPLDWKVTWLADLDRVIMESMLIEVSKYSSL